MNKSFYIALFVALFLSFGAVSADDLNESQTLESNDLQTITTQDSSDSSQVSESINASDESGAYLVLDNDADIENIYIGDLVTWILSAENLGPDISQNTKIYDELPEGLQYLYHSSTKGVFNPETGIWDIGDLTIEDSPVFLYITCKAISVGEKVNKAWITSDTKNLNNETFEEEEIDVFDYDYEYKIHDNVKNEVSNLKSAGNPIFSIIICLFLIFTGFVFKK